MRDRESRSGSTQEERIEFHFSPLFIFSLLDICVFSLCICVFLCVFVRNTYLRASLVPHWASLITQLVKIPPAIRETWLLSLGWEDPLEKRKATHSSILAWRIPWTTVHGVSKSQTRLSNFHFHLQFLVAQCKESTCQCRRHQLNPWSGKKAHVPQLLSLYSRALEPQLLKPLLPTIEPVLRRIEATVIRGPRTSTRE